MEHWSAWASQGWSMGIKVGGSIASVGCSYVGGS